MDLSQYTTWEYWEHWAKVAPIGTMLIALVAACIAIISIKTQEKIARNRAAIDFFLKTELDHNMLERYRDYEQALKRLPAYKSVDDFMENDEKGYWAARVYLDVNELMCTGVNRRVFDEKICLGFWWNILRVAAKDGEAIIKHARQPEDFGHSYDQILALSKRWKNKTP